MAHSIPPSEFHIEVVMAADYSQELCVLQMLILSLFLISASTSARSFTSKLTLPELLNFKTSSGNNTVNVAQQMGTHYSKLGPLLLNDYTGAVTTAIVSQYQRDADAINQEILTRWLLGQGKKPVSWSTLTDVLKEVGLSELSQMIQDSLNRSTTPTSGEMASLVYTVEPLKKGHFGNSAFFLSSEVVLVSEVHEILFYYFYNLMGWNVSNVVKFVHQLVCKVIM